MGPLANMAAHMPGLIRKEVAGLAGGGYSEALLVSYCITALDDTVALVHVLVQHVEVPSLHLKSCSSQFIKLAAEPAPKDTPVPRI